MTKDPKARKAIPIQTGLLDYFPQACAAIANCSHVGNEQHNPGEPMHWAREKSGDQVDCAQRHGLERGTTDKDGLLHATKAAWRALAALEIEIEARRGGIEFIQANRQEISRGLGQATFRRLLQEVTTQEIGVSAPTKPGPWIGGGPTISDCGPGKEP